MQKLDLKKKVLPNIKIKKQMWLARQTAEDYGEVHCVLLFVEKEPIKKTTELTWLMVLPLTIVLREPSALSVVFVLNPGTRPQAAKWLYLLKIIAKR